MSSFVDLTESQSSLWGFLHILPAARTSARGHSPARQARAQAPVRPGHPRSVGLRSQLLPPALLALCQTPSQLLYTVQCTAALGQVKTTLILQVGKLRHKDVRSLAQSLQLDHLAPNLCSQQLHYTAYPEKKTSPPPSQALLCREPWGGGDVPGGGGALDGKSPTLT